MIYTLLKTIHIIGFTAWLGGLFYLVRILVYYREAQELASQEQALFSRQYDIMARRAYKIICNPAMIITWAAGLSMLYINGGEWLKLNYWMHGKLLLVLLLSGYTGMCGAMIKRFAKGAFGKWSSERLRMFNEVPTLLLIFIVVLAVYRNSTNYLMTIGVVVGLGILFSLAVKGYKSHRDKTNQS